MDKEELNAKAEHVAEAVKDPRNWIEPAARAGFAARAVVYATIGVLAGQYALGIGGRATDMSGAMEEFRSGTIGIIVLVLLALGFAGYAGWRATQAIADTDDKGTDMKGLAVRAGYLGGGLVSAALAITAVRILFGERLGDDEGAKDWTARILSASYGPELVMAIGAAIIIYGLWQFYKAFSEKYRKRIDTHDVNRAGRKWMDGVSKVGLSARGIIYALAGVFVVSAAVNSNPNETRDIGQVLATIEQQPYGNALLLVLAVGLIAYAGYAIVNAVYRDIETHAENGAD